MRIFFRALQHLLPSQINHLFHLLQEVRGLLVPAASPLSPEEKHNRSIAEKREGYVRLVFRVADNFTEELPNSFDLGEYKKLLAAREDWKVILLKMEELAELAEDTEYSISVELMKNADRAFKALDAARKTNPALDRAMREIDEYNSQFGARKVKKGDKNEIPPISDTPE
jgi:3-dehydroquinate synthase class II